MGLMYVSVLERVFFQISQSLLVMSLLMQVGFFEEPCEYQYLLLVKLKAIFLN